MRAALLFALLSCLAACGGSGGSDADGPHNSQTAAVCQKIDSCHFLSGMSVSECSATVQQCLNGMLPQQRSDWNTEVARCNSMQACSNFGSCLQAVPGGC